MNYSTPNLNIEPKKKTNQPIIEEQYISLKSPNQNLNNILAPFNNQNDNDVAPYYSNVIQRQNSHSPNHTILLHEFVDDKKVTYKDITNKIDVNELSSKIKSILINTQRIKSIERIKVNNENKAQIYHRKTRSSFSGVQSNSSFTTENESKKSINITGFHRNKNSISNKRVENCNYSTSTFSLNLNNYVNNNYISMSQKKIENDNRLFSDDKYDTKTLKEYLNEQVNSIKFKRYIDETHISNINEHDHNYSIDNENKDVNDKTGNFENILNDDVDNLIITNIKNQIAENIKNNIKIVKVLNDNRKKNSTKNLIDKKSNNNNNDNKKASNYLSYKQNNLKIKSKKKLNKNLTNTFRNSHLNLNFKKNNSKKKLNISNNVKLNKPKFINYNNKNDNLLPKPVKVNTKLSKTKTNNNKINFKSNNLSGTCKSFSMSNYNYQDYIKDINQKKNIYNMSCRNFNIENYKSDQNKNTKKLLEKKTFMKKQNNKKRKNYSEIMKNRIIYSNSNSQKNLKISIEFKKQ